MYQVLLKKFSFKILSITQSIKDKSSQLENVNILCAIGYNHKLMEKSNKGL